MIAITSLIREETVVNHFATRGYKVLGSSQMDTRRLLKMSAAEPAADVLAEASPGRLIIAVVNGTDLDRAITQLQSTVRRAQGPYGRIVCKVFVSNPIPDRDVIDLRGGLYGFRGVRVFRAAFPSEWILYEYDSAGTACGFRLGTEPVAVVFGLHAER